MSPSTDQTVYAAPEEHLREPVAQGSLRVIWCTTCGCVTGIKAPDGAVMGAPTTHAEYHAPKKRRWFRR